jgi:hypothetical protein
MNKRFYLRLLSIFLPLCLVLAACGGGSDKPAATAAPPTSTPPPTATPVPPTPTGFAFQVPPRFPLRSGTRQYSIDQAVEAYLKVAYGNNGAKLLKWVKSPVVALKGNPTPSDVQTVQAVIDELNALTNLQISLKDTNSPDITIFFVAKSDFADTFRQTVPDPTTLNKTLQELKDLDPVAHGVWLYRISLSQVALAVIVIDPAVTTPEVRRRLLLEDIAHGLGLPSIAPNDDAASIFLSKQANLALSNLADIDKFIIWAHYSQAAVAGMTQEEAKQALTTYLRGLRP